ncbi:dihydrodipicolinate synthase family protein [Candidatus Solirubrobacter pratensis]|uniref:dihydrodipicolinate synthase family protein n=1 Tax=Candidatus Solirubrobacter pratensis TaxID=1298857 RepID=UPI0018C96F8C|nr:dihydrodipicolinate synthase family protein [Candidatus Solirubrobacter pratensis]
MSVTSRKFTPTHRESHHCVITGPLKGTVPAAITPLKDGGSALDESAIAPYLDFLIAHGATGVLAMGTTGEGILLRIAERRAVIERYVEAANGRIPVAVHAGAQTTADSVALAVHAAEVGAAAVAVIGPPYFPLDAEGQYRHLRAVAAACHPTPFYVYELAQAAGYAFDPAMLLRLRDDQDNVVGMKVSDAPWEKFERYLLDGYDVLVGPEALIHRGMQAGAVGAVSALASAFPDRVAAVVNEPTEAGAAGLRDLRAAIERTQRHAALKRILARRGVPVAPDVRAPLRDLDAAELALLDSIE